MQTDSNPDGDSLPSEKVDDLAKRLNDPAKFEDAAAEWFNAMFETLHSIARRGISRGLQGRYDAEDITQAAFDSFFKRKSQYANKSTEELKRILVTIAVCKSRGRARAETAECRDPRLEHDGSQSILDKGKKLPSRPDPVRIVDDLNTEFTTLNAAIQGGENPDAPTMLKLLKQNVQPEQAVVLEEIFLLIPDELLGVFLLVIANHTENEMARITNSSRRTITRKKARIRGALLCELEDFGFLKAFQNESEAEQSTPDGSGK